MFLALAVAAARAPRASASSSPPLPRRPRHPPPPPCPQTSHAQHKRRSATGEATIERRATRVKSFDLLRPGETPQSPLVRVRQTCVVFAERGAGANRPVFLARGAFRGDNTQPRARAHIRGTPRHAAPCRWPNRQVNPSFLERAAPPRPCPGSNSHISRVTGHKTETWNIE